MDPIDLRKVRKALAYKEGSTWTDIDKGGSHNVPREDLTAKAQKRLRDIKQDDLDELYSLRLQGKWRIWGN
ncbi:hypothetical protein JYT20_00225 [Rhodothermus sp. AH-315-K08]|nr:hypothetical protein [Rhodothermus sp. AH-315-K08]